jgi:hypothetical protein
VTWHLATGHFIDLDGKHSFAAVEGDNVADLRVIQQHRVKLPWLDWSM